MKNIAVNFADEVTRLGASLICLVGGGGKTSLLHALGEELARRDPPVVCTTSTRMAKPENAALPFFPNERLNDVPLPASGGALVARPAPAGADPAKVYGYTAEELDAFWRSGRAKWLLVEADGAARLPLKAPAPHEPVIPTETGAVVAVVGLGGVGRPFTGETVFRLEQAAAVTGLRPGERITPEAAAKLVCHPNGLFQYAPAGATRLLFCNQSDLPGAEETGLELAAAVSRLCPGGLAGIHIGSLRTKGLSCLKTIPE